MNSIVKAMVAQGLVKAPAGVPAPFRPGMVVPVQLGNDCDTKWCPLAPSVLLSTTMSCFDVDFYAVAKKATGELLILRNVSDGSSGNDIPAGIGYCTTACELESQYLVSIFGKDAVEHIKFALKVYEKKVAELPPFEYVSNR